MVCVPSLSQGVQGSSRESFLVSGAGGRVACVQVLQVPGGLKNVVYGNSGGSGYLCMPSDPDYTLRYQNGVQGHSPLYGTEYQSPVQGKSDHNVPCAVCLASTRETVLMLPAKTSCPTSWTEEYDGYLMDSALYMKPRVKHRALTKNQLGQSVKT